MKPILYSVLPLFGFVAALPLVAADSNSGQVRVYAQAQADDAPKKTTERRVNVRTVSGPVEMEKVTFLGVSTSPVSPVLTAQLGLPKGAGLVVNQIVPGSPAAGVIEQHDILLKLDDQQLIEANQLAVLVRNHKDGDEVTLTYVRAGKQATAKVKLAMHDAPKVVMSDLELDVMPFRMTKPDQTAGRQELDRVLSLIDAGNAHSSITLRGNGNSNSASSSSQGMRTISINTGNSSMVFTDDEGSMEITMKDGKKMLVAKDAKGAEIFNGPVTTPDERKALPAPLAARLDKLERMQGFEFKTGPDFKGGEVKVFTPPGRSISLPHVMITPRQRVEAF